ncbi:hypothetical protein ABHI18_012443 [Aspergillus niger]
MAMALESEEEPNAWARDLAYHLSWEFWMQDHASLVKQVMISVFKGNIPDQPPQEAGLKIKQKVKEMLETEDMFYPDDLDLKEVEDPYYESMLATDHEPSDKWWKKHFREKGMDTVAVALYDNKVLIAVNIKARIYRYLETGGKKGVKEQNEEGRNKLGFFDGRFIDTIKQTCKQYNQAHGKEIYLLRPEQQPKTIYQNAAPHAEMQIIRYCRGNLGYIKVIGVSKLACRQCRVIMNNRGVRYYDREYNAWGIPLTSDEVEKKLGSARIENWLHPDTTSFENYFGKFGEVIAEPVGQVFGY